MGHAQLIRGSAAELKAELERLGARDDLMLIVPDAGHTQMICDEGPEQAERRNGVALFPTQGVPGIVTDELVRRILEEDE